MALLFFYRNNFKYAILKNEIVACNVPAIPMYKNDKKTQSLSKQAGKTVKIKSVSKKFTINKSSGERQKHSFYELFIGTATRNQFFLFILKMRFVLNKKTTKTWPGIDARALNQ